MHPSPPVTDPSHVRILLDGNPVETEAGLGLNQWNRSTILGYTFFINEGKSMRGEEGKGDEYTRSMILTPPYSTTWIAWEDWMVDEPVSSDDEEQEQEEAVSPGKEVKDA